METTALRLNSQETGSAISQTLSPQQVEFSKQFAQLPVKPMGELIQTQSKALHMLDKQALSFCVSAAIGKYLNFIGCSMTEEATYETAQMMIDTHPHLPVDAIKTFFYECKRGTFGFHYNKMDGSKLLIWFDKFCEDYYKSVEDMEYNKHLDSKEDVSEPIDTDEELVTVDMDELYASFTGKTREQKAREDKVHDIRLRVINANMHLYNELSPQDAEARIEELVIDEMRKENLITF